MANILKNKIQLIKYSISSYVQDMRTKTRRKRRGANGTFSVGRTEGIEMPICIEIPGISDVVCVGATATSHMLDLTRVIISESRRQARQAKYFLSAIDL